MKPKLPLHLLLPTQLSPIQIFSTTRMQLHFVKGITVQLYNYQVAESTVSTYLNVDSRHS